MGYVLLDNDLCSPADTARMRIKPGQWGTIQQLRRKSDIPRHKPARELPFAQLAACLGKG